MTKRLLSFLAVFVFAVTMTVTAADARISLGADLVERFQSTEPDGASTSSSFQNPAANLHIYGDVASDVDAYVELHVLRDVAFLTSAFDLDQVRINEGYISLNNLGPMSLKTGKFEVDFGNRHLERSDNAQVQENPLIGNDLMDVVGDQAGLELSGESAGGNMGWALGITNGTNNSSFADDAGYALIPKVWGNFGPGLSGALSYYTVDHSTTGPSDNLFTHAATVKHFYHSLADPYGGFFATGPVSADLGNAASGNGGGGGASIAAWQLDFGWENQMADVDFWWGSVEDDATSPASEMSYYGLEGAFNFTPSAYGAARYSVVTDDSSGAPSGDQSDRLQVGVGYNLNENTVAKFEWVDQTNEQPTTGGGVGADNSGFLAELSASF